jgi:hypothetical protein
MGFLDFGVFWVFADLEWLDELPDKTKPLT